MPTDALAASQPAARASKVEHRFGGRVVLAGVDLELRRGAITALVGANGSGKTTLLRILAGILEPSAGEVEVLGVHRPARRGGGARRALRRRASYLSQDPALDPEMTGGEILALAATLHGVPRRRRRRRVAELAAAFGIEPDLARRVGTWSGGQRRRLHLAFGMVDDPELLLLDEPTAGLDPDACHRLWADLAARAGRGCAVAVVTHDLAAVERHAATVVLLDRGSLLAAGSPEEVRRLDGGTAADLAEAFRRRTGRDAADLLPRPRRAS
jgi:ABC-2 type transport system ATP-binding protein